MLPADRGSRRPGPAAREGVWAEVKRVANYRLLALGVPAVEIVHERFSARL